LATSDRPDWFKIEAKAKGSKEASKIFIYDMIGEGWFDEGIAASAFVKDLEKIDSDHIQVHINSPGGNFWEAMAIYNNLRRHPAQVTSIVDGYAASAASLVALAGDEVIMAQGSQMMIHNAAGIVMGNSEMMRKVADDLDKLNASMAAVYAAKGGGKQDDWRTAMSAETWYTAQEAVDAGLADRTEEVKVPAEVKPQASFDLSRFKFPGREKAPQPQAIAKQPDLPADQPPAGAKPPVASAAESHQTEGAGHMTDPAKLRESFALPESASEEEVRSAMIAAGVHPVASATQPEPAEDIDQLRKRAEALGVRLVEAGQYDEAQAQLAQVKAQERDKIIDEAIKDGRILPANRPTWVANYDANPEGTKALIAQLMPGLVPMAEMGYGSDLDDDDLFGGMPAEFANLWPRPLKGA
jgi:ATP-dependent protease ClpP protease subunit